MSQVDLDLDDEAEESVEIEPILARFHNDITKVAEYYIGLFFAEKQWYGGGPIPDHTLLSPANVDLVLNTEMCNGIDKAYEVLEADDKCGEDEDRNPKEVQMVLDIFRQCELLLIPKEFAPGLMLLCLEICHGIRPAPVGGFD